MKFKDMPYQRFDLDKKRDELLAIMEEFKACKSGEEQFEVHKKFYKIVEDYRTPSVIASIRHDIDVTDEFYKNEREYYDKISPEVENLFINYKNLALESPYRAYLEEKISKVAFKSMEIEKKASSEKTIPLQQEENALRTRYAALIASAKIPWENEELNLSLLVPYLTNDDREIRKKAWKKYSKYFSDNKEELDEIYDKLVKNRTEQAKILGFDSFTEVGYLRMNRNDYNREDVENFRKQIKEYFVPFAAKIHEKRRKRLGLEKLSYIDEGVYYKDGNPKPVGTPEEIMANGQVMYSELSKETKEFFDFMMENQLFDVLGRKTKKAGGYMTYIDKYNSPFIFANFNGTVGDVDVITHECGHAFQGYISGKDPIIEHRDITMETAEIHSMSMEFFTRPWMNKFFNEKDKEKFLEMQIESAAIFIPYGTMVDEFQHIVYDNPNMTPDERKAVWSKLEKEYKPYLDYEDDEFFGKGGYWQRQLHIYEMPFYYIDYVLAQSCAFQFLIKMTEDYNKAWDSYLELCKLSASDFYSNMLNKVGIEVPFKDGTIKNLVEKLEQFIK